MVQSLPRYIVGCTPRVNGGSPGNPSFSPAFQPLRSSGTYSRSIGRLLTVVNSSFLSGFLSSAGRSVPSSQSRRTRGFRVDVRPPFFGFISVLFQDLLGDHQPLDLGRAFVALGGLRVPEQPVHRAPVDVPLTAVYLHAFFRCPPAGRRGYHLRHARRGLPSS